MKAQIGDRVLIRHPMVGSRWFRVVDSQPDYVDLKDLYPNPDDGGWNFSWSCVAKVDSGRDAAVEDER